MSLWQDFRAQFERDCANAVQISRENLRRLMEDNKNTSYGKRCHFSEVAGVEDYRRLVPVSDYASYEEDIRRMRAGEKDTMTVYAPKHYIMTSGSTGQVKMVPLTQEAIDRCVDWIYYAAFACVPGIEQARLLLLSVFRMEPPAPEPETIISAACYREYYDRGTYGLEERYVGGSELMFTKGLGDVLYARLWMALSEPELTGIQSFFLYEILLFFRYFEENWESMLQDLKSRHIPEELPFSDRVRAALLALPEPSDEYLDHVRRECQAGFSGIAKRVWKKLAFVSGAGGGTFYMQDAALRYYLDVPVHYFGYAASECLMGVAIELEKAEYVLTPSSGYFEFIPYGEDETDTRCRGIDELEVGKRYELLVTNFSGLYRYRLNDVLEIRGFYGQSPVVAVCFRKNQAINIDGEKMDLQVIAMAAQEMGKKFGLHIHEFSCYDDKTLVPGRYQCFMEAHEIRSGEDAQKFRVEDLAGQLDAILGRFNEDYRDLRHLELIGAPAVHIVPMGTHERCKQTFLGRQGQMKPLQYLADPEVIAYMSEHVF